MLIYNRRRRKEYGKEEIVKLGGFDENTDKYYASDFYDDILSVVIISNKLTLDEVWDSCSKVKNSGQDACQAETKEDLKEFDCPYAYLYEYNVETKELIKRYIPICY